MSNGRAASAKALRRDAIRFFKAAVEAADPAKAVAGALTVRSGKLSIRTKTGGARSKPWTGVRIVAFGKAALAMAKAAKKAVPKKLFRGPGIVVTNYENAENAKLAGFTVLGAGHPLPDENGVLAAKAVADYVGEAAKGELVLVLVSGGGSALLPLPADGLMLDDKIATTNLLLASGADIGEINTVRKHLSRLKGGGLARLAAPADLHALILSDVLGDDLSTIASGPTVPDPTRFSDARRVLKRRGVWDKVPDAVRRRIEAGIAKRVAETPKPGDAVFSGAAATLIGSNGVSLARLREAAKRAGYAVAVFDDCLTGEARKAAAGFVKAACAAAKSKSRRKRALIAGGETTVILKGKGRGGRNQEMTLAFAIEAEKRGLRDFLFLSGGTDGRDGPTDAAGGTVDSGTLARIRAKGAHPRALLDDNDSYKALTLAGDLLQTGATGTNVADLQILLLAP
jgi:hydroxypyruvate reductase